MPRLRYIGGELIEEALRHEEAQPGDRSRHPVAIPTADRPAGDLLTAGEFDGVRETRAAQAASVLEQTDGSPAAREWVERKTNQATLRWDAGVRDGSIRRNR